MKRRQGLVADQRLRDDLARLRRIERVRGDQIAALAHDEIGILGDFELLVAVVAMEAHALADDLQNVDDAERLFAFVGAELAMIAVIDRDQRIDTRRARGVELGALQFALVGGQHAEIDALQPDGRLLEVDKLDAGHGVQKLEGGLDDAGNAGMPVQRDAHPDTLVQWVLSWSSLLFRNRMNGVISNGRAPRCRSIVGSVVSVNCT